MLAKLFSTQGSCCIFLIKAQFELRDGRFWFHFIVFNIKQAATLNVLYYKGAIRAVASLCHLIRSRQTKKKWEPPCEGPRRTQHQSERSFTLQHNWRVKCHDLTRSLLSFCVFFCQEESGETVCSERNGVAKWICPLCQKGQSDRSSMSLHLTEQHSVLPSCVGRLLDIVSLVREETLFILNPII